jgi:hypothetical protein
MLHFIRDEYGCSSCVGIFISDTKSFWFFNEISLNLDLEFSSIHVQFQVSILNMSSLALSCIGIYLEEFHISSSLDSSSTPIFVSFHFRHDLIR